MTRIVTFGIIAALVAAFGSGAAAAPKAQKVTIVAREFTFTPTTITIRAGVPVELSVVNRGTVEHEFMVYTRPKTAPDDWDEYAIANTYFQDIGEAEVVFRDRGAVAGTRLFEVELEKGRSATVLFTPAKKGSFEIGCHVEGHYEAGMKATLIVK